MVAIVVLVFLVFLLMALAGLVDVRKLNRRVITDSNEYNAWDLECISRMEKEELVREAMLIQEAIDKENDHFNPETGRQYD